MSAFKSEKTIHVSVPDLAPVSAELAAHFRERGFQVEENETDAGWEVSITKGGMFKASVGLKIGLNITISPQAHSTLVRTAAGVFGRQAVPTALSMFIAWPVLLTQAWGVINQAGLNKEAVSVVELSLARHARLAQAGAAHPSPATVPAQRAGADGHAFCTNCGREQHTDARFCPWCGREREGYTTAR